MILGMWACLKMKYTNHFWLSNSERDKPLGVPYFLTNLFVNPEIGGV
jgi:hypothetical protein